MSLPYFLYPSWFKYIFILASTVCNHGSNDGCMNVSPPWYRYWAPDGKVSLLVLGHFNEFSMCNWCWSSPSPFSCLSSFVVISIVDFSAHPEMRYKAVSSPGNRHYRLIFYLFNFSCHLRLHSFLYTMKYTSNYCSLCLWLNCWTISS